VNLDEAISAAPEDDEPRLVWARAQGGPRGELVEVQCALARGDEDPRLAAREAALLEAYGDEWAAPLTFSIGAHRYRFARGFVEHVEITAARLVRRGAGLRFGHNLIRSLRVIEAEGRIADVLAVPGLAALAALDLSENRLTNRDAGLIAEAPLGGLRSLELGRNDLDDRGVETLAEATGPRRIESLGLAANVVELDGARALAASPLPLVELDVEQMAFDGHDSGNVIGPPALRVLLGRPWRRLVVSGNPVDSVGAEIIAASASGLEVLVARGARIGPSGAWALAASQRLAGLRVLDLGGNPLGDEGAAALESSPFLSSDLRLRVDDSGLSPVLSARLAARFPRVVS